MTEKLLIFSLFFYISMWFSKKEEANIENLRRKQAGKKCQICKNSQV